MILTDEEVNNILRFDCKCSTFPEDALFVRASEKAILKKIGQPVAYAWFVDDELKAFSFSDIEPNTLTFASNVTKRALYMLPEVKA